MTVCATCIERPLRFGSGGARRPVPGMALKAQERQLLCQKIIVNRTVGHVTSPAILRYLRMFEDKGSFLFGMALGAGLLYVRLPEHLITGCPVWIMAAYAEDPLFVYWMVAWQRELGLHFNMTLLAHTFHIVESYSQIRSRMDQVTLGAGNVSNGVGACVPVMKVECRIGGMAFQAYK